MSQRLKPVMIGITGGSASGKTTFAKALVEELADLSTVVLHQDAYFRDWSEYPPEAREKAVTANHPDAIQWEPLIGHIRQLVERQTIQTPVPGTRSASRGDPPTVIGPADVVIVEGHLILWHERLRELMDIKLFLDVDSHERVLRRLLRDVGDRGGDLNRAVAWYRKDVLPNFPIYTEPCKQFADLVLPYQHDNPVALGIIAAGIREQCRIIRCEEGDSAHQQDRPDTLLGRPSESNSFLQRHVKLLRTSFQYHTGRELLSNVLSDVDAARELFHAPWAVVSHDTAADPIFTYGNQTALDLFEMPWEEFTSLPSCQSAEPASREERAALIKEVSAKGFIEDYTGIRISKGGKRFLIRNATVWNLIDEAGCYQGQAAVFRDWEYLT